jgi:SAM-dependent methyltransferase
VALGLFVGCLPLYGFHLPLCLAIGLPLRLDVVVAYLAANISNPFVAPFLLALEVEVGFLAVTGHLAPLSMAELRDVGLASFAVQAAVGAVIVGTCLAAMGAALTWSLVGRSRGDPDPLDSAIERTIARYRGAPRGDRIYVAAKLRSDPIVSALATLQGTLGTIVDVGAGRGQLSLLLLEMGRAADAVGFDWDARKIGVARAAAQGIAEFVEGDMRDFRLPEADTILMADVLHYLAHSEQNALIERAVQSLRAGGRLLVREVEDRSAWRAWITRTADRIAALVGYNKGARLHYPSMQTLTRTLETLGLECARLTAGVGLLSNVLIVGRKP